MEKDCMKQKKVALSMGCAVLIVIAADTRAWLSSTNPSLSLHWICQAETGATQFVRKLL